MEKIIAWILQTKWRKRGVIAIVLMALGASVMMLPTKLVLAKMLPGKSANTFTIYIDLPTNSSIRQTAMVAECVGEHLKKEREVTDIETYLGQGAPLDYAGLVKGSDFKRMKYQAEVVVNLTDKHTREEPSFMMVHRLRPVIQHDCESMVEGTTIKFIEMPSGPPTLATIVIELYGKNDALLRTTSERIADILRSTDGLVDVDVMHDTIFTKYELVPDKEKILRSGLSVDQVNKILYLAFKGMPIAVKNTRNQQDQIPIFVRLSEKSHRFRHNSKEALETKLSSLKLMNRMGMMIPLKEVVDVAAVPSSPTIFRKNLRNMTTITAECDMISQVYPLLDAREKMLHELSDEFNVTKDPGISTYMFDLHLKRYGTGEKMLLRWDGEMKVTLDTFRDLGGAFIAALVLMFLLMVVYYKSYALSGIVLAGSFLSIIGVIAGHWVTDKIQLYFTDTNFFLTATSLIGFISLMGISARSSLLLIDFSRALIAEGMEKQKAIAIATATRAKPIMLTAVAIILGSLLLATDPIFGGLGVALIFGSMAATLVSLFFIPVLMDNAEAMEWLKEEAEREKQA
ncbi:MAG TPA: efflux RND transporter permease subunit [Campylobacteraceae bacterium]|nr:efflux RND transporter permease subunit [Campylobacteraceae bacterium]